MSRTIYLDCHGNEIELPKADQIPITNADRIRAMSDEELAAAICKIEQMTAKQGHRGFHAWLDWLKKEADNGKN